MNWIFRRKFKRFKRHPPVNSNNNIRNSPEAYCLDFEHAPSNSPILIQTSLKKDSKLQSKRYKLPPPQQKKTGPSQVTPTRKDVKVSRVHFKSGDPCESIDMNKLNEYYPIIKSTFEQNKNHPKASISTSVINPKQPKRDLKTGVVNERSCDSIHPKRTENKRKYPTRPIENKAKEPQIIKLQVPLKCLMDSNDDSSKSESESEHSQPSKESPKPIERIKMIKIFPPVPKRSFMKTDVTVPVPVPRVKVNTVPCVTSRMSNVVKNFEEIGQNIQTLEFGDSISSLSSYPSEVGRHIQQNHMLSKFIKKNQSNCDGKLVDQESEIVSNKKLEPKTPKNSLSSFVEEKHSLGFQKSNELTVIYECKDASANKGKQNECEISAKMESYTEMKTIDPTKRCSFDVSESNSSNSAAVIWPKPQAMSPITPKVIFPKTPSNPEIRMSLMSSKPKRGEACTMSKRPTFTNKLRTIKSQIVPLDNACETNSNTVTPETSSSEDNFKSETKINISCCGHNNKLATKTSVIKTKPISDSKPMTCDKTSSTSPLPKNDASSSTQTENCCQLKCSEPLSNEMIDINFKLPNIINKKYSNAFDSPVESSYDKSSKMTLTSMSPDSGRFGECQEMKYLSTFPEIRTSSQNKINPPDTSLPSKSKDLQEPTNGTKIVPIPQVLYAHAYRTIETINYDKISGRIIQSLQGTRFSDFPKYEEPRNCLAPYICPPSTNKNEVTRLDAYSNLNFHCDHVRENNYQSMEEITPSPKINSYITPPTNDSENDHFPSDKVIEEVTSFHKDSLVEVNKLSANIQSKFNFMKSMNSKKDFGVQSNFDSGQYFSYLSDQLEKSGDQIKSTRNPFQNHDRTRSPDKSCLSNAKSRSQNVESEKYWHARSSPENFKQFSRHTQSPPHNFKSPKFHDDERETNYRNVEMRSKCRNEDLDNISEGYSEESLCTPGSYASQSICRSNTALAHRQKPHNFSFPNCGHNSTRCGRCSRNSPKARVMMHPPKSSSRNSHHRHHHHHHHKHCSPLAQSEPQMSGSALFRAAAHVTKEFTSANIGRKKLHKSIHVSDKIEELKRLLAEGFKSKKCSRSHCHKEKVTRTQNRDDCQHNVHSDRQYIIEPLSRNSRSKRDKNMLRERVICVQNRDDCCQHDGHKHCHLEPIRFNDLKLHRCLSKGSMHNMHASESPRFFQHDSKRDHHHHHHHSSPNKSSHHHFMHGGSPCMHGRNNSPKNWKHSQHSYFDLTANNILKRSSPVWKFIR